MIRTTLSTMILEGLLMIVDNVWKLTNTVRVGLDDGVLTRTETIQFPG